MINLHSIPARICPTAEGYLIHENKILLVKHKKLGFWLPPGGHVESGELPYQTAEREVFEETGITVKAMSPFPLIESDESEFIPTPFASGLHWISRDNYETRIASHEVQEPTISKKWPRGCEQHLGHEFLVTPVSDIVTVYDPNESDDIGWFRLNDLPNLTTNESVKEEIQLAFITLQYVHDEK